MKTAMMIIVTVIISSKKGENKNSAIADMNAKSLHNSNFHVECGLPVINAFSSNL